MNALLEALRVLRASRVPAALIALVTGLGCAGIALTTGATAAAGADLGMRLEAAGSRVLTIVDVSGEGYLSSTAREQISTFGAVERAVGLSLPADVHNPRLGPGSSSVPSWVVSGSLADMVEMTDGRWAQPGEAMVSVDAREALGLADGFGAVSDGSVHSPVVGTFRVRQPFERYSAGVVVAEASAGHMRSLHVVTGRARDSQVVQSAALDVVGAPPGAIQVESPVDLAALQQAVIEDFEGYGRQMLAGLLAATAFLVSVVVAADVMLHRRDLGRRRVLGASRGFVVGLVVSSAVLPASAGAVVAVVATNAWVVSAGGRVVPWSFSFAIALTCVLTCAAAAVLPAWYAAVRDPLRVLRTP